LTAGRLLFLLPLVYLAIFFVYPLGSILERSLWGESGFGFDPFKVLLNDSYYLGRIWFTVWQAVVSTLLTLAVGLPAAFLFARYEFPGKTLLKAISTLPFVMPTIVVAMGFTALFGSQGIVNSALESMFGLDEPPVRISNSLTIIFMAHAFYNYAIIVRIVSALWSNLDPNLEHSAKVLGAGPFRTFYHVTLPMLLPAIASASLLAFAFSFTSFGVVLVLGGPEFATLEVAIYELTAKLFRLPLAGALSIIQLGFTYFFLLLYSRFQEQSVVRMDLKPREATSRKPVRLWDKVLVIAMVLVLLAMLSPLIALVVRWITFDGGFGTAQMANLFSDERRSYFHLSPVKIIWNSLRFALTTVAISLVVGTIISYFITNVRRRWRNMADALVMLPLGVSAVTLGFGYIIALGRPPLDLRGSWLILVIAHSLVAYPFVIRSLLPVLKGMNPNLREAAAVLGASPSKVFLLVELPMIAPALLVGATFAFAVSMGEFGASLILVRAEFTTMPVAIFRFLGLPGASNLGMALGMSVLLMAVVAVGFIAIERFRYKGVGGF
jgi:thiamine transport system permease protein